MRYTASDSAVTAEKAPVHAFHFVLHALTRGRERLLNFSLNSLSNAGEYFSTSRLFHLAIPRSAFPVRADFSTAGSFRGTDLAFATTDEALRRFDAVPGAGRTFNYRPGRGFAFRERARA